MSISIITDLLNSCLLVFIVYAVLFGKKQNTKRLIKLEEEFAELKKSIEERNEVLDSSSCFQGARVALLLNKEFGKPNRRKDPETVLRKLKEVFGDDAVNVKKTTLDIDSETFGDDIQHLDSDILRQLLEDMKSQERYRQAEAIKQVLAARGV